MWLVGALIAACGTAVYIELGTVYLSLKSKFRAPFTTFFKGLPRSGGEKNYLEYIYRRPEFMATCTFAVSILVLASNPYRVLISTAISLTGKFNTE